MVVVAVCCFFFVYDENVPCISRLRLRWAYLTKFWVCSLISLASLPIVAVAADGVDAL